MLLSFTVRNFRSFAEEATLSMVSSRLKTNVPRSGQTWIDCSERVAAIYGPNAAGKTTVLEAIWALSKGLRKPGSSAVRQPSEDGGRSLPVEYLVDFVAQGVRYNYEVHTSSWGVSCETLYSYPKGARRLIFTRSQPDAQAAISFEKGSSVSGPTAEVLKITKRTALFLATAHKYEHEVLAPIAQSLMADVGIGFITFRDRQDEDVLRRVLLEMLDAPNEQVDLVNALLRAADVGISGIEVRKEEIPAEVWEKVRRVLEALRDGDEPLEEDAIPRLKEVVTFQHTGDDGREFTLPVDMESAGTITWLTTAWHALDALRKGTILLIDELDASLHPELARYLVKLFLLPQLNPRGAQLLFTSHDVSLLANAPTRLLEPQNVWFVEKDASGHSELFSLAEFDNRAANNNERRYLAGQFGAIPDIDDSLLLTYIAVEEGNMADAGA